MKVYIVYSEYSLVCECDDCLGIFSTREKAQARIDRFRPKDRYGMYIDEYELDCEER